MHFLIKFEIPQYYALIKHFHTPTFQLAVSILHFHLKFHHFQLPNALNMLFSYPCSIMLKSYCVSSTTTFSSHYNLSPNSASTLTIIPSIF
mmetsp:Transcript_10089/g.1496  ORF Transcript_10089/g.1496 Transcript_10089/m.1496 type:complete len:91 (+) Transcript_10089:468-740(+)